MQKHTKIYLTAFGFDLTDNNSFVPSEISGSRGVDLHHIIGRGKKGEDRIENLICLTRQEHIDYGDKKEFMVYLLKTHRTYLQDNRIDFCNEWFEEKINYYDN
jgi:hypothetical protein